MITSVIRYQPGDTIDGNVYGSYYIDLYENGMPVNGNGVTVQYQSRQGGTLGAVQSAYITGFNKKIYNGVVQSGDGDMLYYDIVAPPSDPVGPPPPTNPDLKLISVVVTKNANSAGVNGQVTITASSSFGPIQYYIDGILLTSPINAAVTAGNHIATVNDTNGVPIDLAFNVDKVDSILVKDPSYTSAGKTSRWNAAFNPVYFEFARKDFSVTSIAQDTATLKAKFTLNASLSKVAAGDLVYIDAGLTNTVGGTQSTYKGAYKVLSVTLPNIIVIDVAYVAPDSIAGFVNVNSERPYYKIDMLIKYIDPATGLFNTIDATFRPLMNGVTKADISSFLQSLLKPSPDQSNYTQVNYRDAGLSASYQVTYAEVWEGNTPEYVSITDPYYVIYAAKQLGELGGGNIFNQVTQQGGTQLAKWLSDFVMPAYTIGYPFDLPFIYSEKIAGLQIYSKLTMLDINQQPLPGSATTTFLLNENSTFLLQQDGYKFIIARQTLVNTPIVEHVGLNRLNIDGNYPNTCYFIQVQLFYDIAGTPPTPVAVTEPIVVRVDRRCQTNPVFLRWIGLNGSWNYYRFNYNQEVTLDVQNAVVTKNYVLDWQNGESIDDVISKDAGEKMQVMADAMDINDIKGLQSIKFSPKVQILVDKTALKWHTIVVNSSTFAEYSTVNGEAEFSITFNKPAKNIQTQ